MENMLLNNKSERKSSVGQTPANAELSKQIATLHGKTLVYLQRQFPDRDTHWLEDVAQETMLRALRGAPRFCGNSQVATWVTRIAMNCAIERLRYEQRRPDLSSRQTKPGGSIICLQEREEPHSLQPEREAIRSEVCQGIDQAIAALPLLYRKVIQLMYCEGMRLGEAATVLGAKERAVRSRLHRGRQMLAAILRSNGIDRTALPHMEA